MRAALTLRRNWPAITAGAVAVLSGWHFTSGGVGVSADSVVYLSVAANLNAGDGLVALSRSGATEPLTFYPPLYPVVLAATSLSGLDGPASARVVSVAAFAATAAVVAGVVCWATHDRLAGLGAGLTAAWSVPLWSVAGWALTEPVFLLAVLAALWVAAADSSGHGRGAWAIAGIAAAAAALTRYAGIAVVAAVPGALLLGRVLPAASRVRRAAGAGALGAVPIGAWIAWTRAVSPDAGGRTFVPRAIDTEQFERLAATVRSWVAPDSGAWATMAGLVVLTAIVLTGRPRRGRGRALVVACAVTAVAYAVVLVANDTLFTDATHWNNRILAPLYLIGLVVSWTALARLRAGSGARWAAAVLVAAGLVAASALRAIDTSPADRDTGFRDPPFAGSAVVDAARGAPTGAPIFSNYPDAITFLTGRVAVSVPQRSSPHTGKVSPTFERDMRAVVDGMRAGGLLAWFADDGRAYLAGPEAIARLVGLRELVRTPDGVVYAAA